MLKYKLQKLFINQYFSGSTNGGAKRLFSYFIKKNNLKT